MTGYSDWDVKTERTEAENKRQTADKTAACCVKKVQKNRGNLNLIGRDEPSGVYKLPCQCLEYIQNRNLGCDIRLIYEDFRHVVADGVVSYLCKRGSTVVCNGNQHAAPLFQLNGKVDCLLGDPGFREGDGDGIFCHVLKDRKIGIIHVQAEPADIGEEAGPVFCQNSGSSDSDQKNPVGVL